MNTFRSLKFLKVLPLSTGQAVEVLELEAGGQNLARNEQRVPWSHMWRVLLTSCLLFCCCLFLRRMDLRTKGTSNLDLLEGLRKQKIIQDDRIFNMMARVDRGNFCKSDPYYDRPKSIGYGATISAPHMHAYALEYLKDKLQPGCKALDVGSGSGYLTAVMGYMVSEAGDGESAANGKVIGVEHIPELVTFATENVRRANSDLLDKNIISFVCADGRQGYPKEAPYDAIHVGAAVESTPTTLINQLKAGGKLIVPVGADQSDQQLKMYTKNADGNGFKTNTLLGVVYVPLTDQESQRVRASPNFWFSRANSEL